MSSRESVLRHRGTDGVANLRVIEDYPMVDTPPAFWFEVHLAFLLEDDDAHRRAANTASAIKEHLRNNRLGEIAKIVLNGDARVNLPTSKDREHLAALLAALYQVSPG